MSIDMDEPIKNFTEHAANEIKKNNEILAELVPAKNAELGAKVYEKAVERFDKVKTEQVLSQVTSLMAELENARNWESVNRLCAEIIERKIAAVKAGQFRIDGYRQIIFEDDSLNKPYPQNMGFNPHGQKF
jgi:hypothetical protein